MIELSFREVEVLVTLVGLFVGSFLNVAVHRYPLEGQSVARPRRSRCPSCRHELSWRENVPLLSWLLQRGRCRWCGWRIPVRYPLLEALTALVWWHAARTTGPGEAGLLAARLLLLTGLLYATFVDLDVYEIPDLVSIGGIVLAPLISFLVPELHADTAVARAMSGDGPVGGFAAFTASLAGIAAGGGILWLVAAVGAKAFGRDAMGLGDVKLLAAGGGFIGPGGVLATLLVGSLLGALAGVANVARFHCLLGRRDRARGRRRGAAARLSRARELGRYIPFGPFLAVGIALCLLHWKSVGIALARWNDAVARLFG